MRNLIVLFVLMSLSGCVGYQTSPVGYGPNISILGDTRTVVNGFLVLTAASESGVTYQWKVSEGVLLDVSNAKVLWKAPPYTGTCTLTVIGSKAGYSTVRKMTLEVVGDIIEIQQVEVVDKDGGKELNVTMRNKIDKRITTVFSRIAGFNEDGDYLEYTNLHHGIRLDGNEVKTDKLYVSWKPEITRATGFVWKAYFEDGTLWSIE